MDRSRVHGAFPEHRLTVSASLKFETTSPATNTCRAAVGRSARSESGNRELDTTPYRSLRPLWT
jgi:hypothetical protein